MYFIKEAEEEEETARGLLLYRTKKKRGNQTWQPRRKSNLSEFSID
jgi:hypothetical protein